MSERHPKDAVSPSEATVLASVIAEPGEELTPALSALLAAAPDSFEDPRHGAVALVIRCLRAEGKPANELTVPQALHGREGFENAYGFIASLGDALPTGLAEHEAQTLLEAFHRRVARRSLADAAEAVAANPGRAVEILRHAVELVGDGPATAAAPSARALFEVPEPPAVDPDELLRDRYLRRGGTLLLAAPTGIGKSSFTMQAAVSWALGRDHFGIEPARELSTLVIQGENDDADVAQMRDGIAAGLELTPGQQASVNARVFIYNETTSTGFAFFADVVRPLLVKHKPDLLIIDPVFSYLGASANEQEAVTVWLRNQLNPCLREHGCAAMLVHHTNKPPSGKEKSTWQAGELSYLGSGSSEFANHARAVLGIRSLGSHSTFELCAPKRGGRLRWIAPDGTPTFSRTIAHAREQGRIFWRDADPGEVPTKGRPKTFDEGEVVDLLGTEGLRTTDWLTKAVEELGLGKSRFYEVKAQLTKSGTVTKSPVDDKWRRA